MPAVKGSMNFPFPLKVNLKGFRSGPTLVDKNTRARWRECSMETPAAGLTHGSDLLWILANHRFAAKPLIGAFLFEGTKW